MYEVEIFDRDGRRRPGMFPKLLRIFRETLHDVSEYGETRQVSLGLKAYWLRPVGAPPSISERNGFARWGEGPFPFPRGRMSHD